MRLIADPVALEVARRLRDHGRDVDRLIVVRGDPSNVKLAWFKRVARRLGMSPLNVRRWTQALCMRLGRARRASKPLPESIVARAPSRAYIAATENFIPATFSVGWRPGACGCKSLAALRSTWWPAILTRPSRSHVAALADEVAAKLARVR